MVDTSWTSGYRSVHGGKVRDMDGANDHSKQKVKRVDVVWTRGGDRGPTRGANKMDGFR